MHFHMGVRTARGPVGRCSRMLHGASWTVGVGVAPLSSIYGRGGVGVHLAMA
ncbi:hypothetical protein BDZ89DRAFT_1067520, partial [Hymenopellis radicata]